MVLQIDLSNEQVGKDPRHTKVSRTTKRKEQQVQKTGLLINVKLHLKRYLNSNKYVLMHIK